MSPLLAATGRRSEPAGSAKPRLAPPLPARSDLSSVKEVAAKVELELFPWQLTAFRYLMARGPTSWLWKEVATIVARQNGKTTILELLVLVRLLMGHRITHVAQDRALPRESFEHIADLVSLHYRDQLGRNGIRTSNGQERIRLHNGGTYRIVAPTRSAARGRPNDLFLVDEVLDMYDFDVIAAGAPTVDASPEAQIAYFSNAGMPESIVLNSLKARGGSDPSLAYLEWSAPEELAPDNAKGWRMANPSVGHMPALLHNIELSYTANLLGNSMDVFERERLCRWTSTAGHLPLLTDADWERVEQVTESPTRSCHMGIKMDPSGQRASAVAAWSDGDKVWLDVVAEATGDPVKVELFGPEMRRLARQLKVRAVGFDPYSDADLARYFRKSESLTGSKYAQASAKFVKLAQARQLAVRDPAGLLAADLRNTVRVSDKHGSYSAAKESAETTNTAIEAAIRAAWMASAPQPRVAVY